MSDRAKNQTLAILGAIATMVTIFIQVVKVGEIKGVIESGLQQHETRITATEGDVKNLNHAVSNIEGRLHGIASEVGKVPNKVAAKINEPSSIQHKAASN